MHLCEQYIWEMCVLKNSHCQSTGHILHIDLVFETIIFYSKGEEQQKQFVI